MDKLWLAALLACAATGARAQVATAPERAPEYAHLENFIGEWTVKGREDGFREVCRWYDGHFHVVCHSESKRQDGSTGHGMSILTFVPGQGFMYTGIGSKGRYETQQGGTFRDGVFEFLDTRRDGGTSVVTRIRMGPYTPEGFAFVVDSSTNGGDWSPADTTHYLRLKQGGGH